jgi:DNA-binding beta-propeller fold protein YncE
LQQVNNDQKFFPQYIFIDKNTNDLYVSDSQNNRVMVFGFGNNTAKLIYGNPQNIVLNPPTATSFNSPIGVVVDQSSSVVYIADTGNNRVLKYLPGQTTPIAVIGQSSFTSNTQFSASATSVFAPRALAIENGNLFVSDGYNRILAFSSSTGEVSTSATALYGQSSFSGSSFSGVSAQTVKTVVSIAFFSNNMYVVDDVNNRITSFPPAQIQQFHSESATCTNSITSYFVTFPTTCSESLICSNGDGLVGSITQCAQFVAPAQWSEVAVWDSSTSCENVPSAVISAPVNTCSGIWTGGSTYSLDCTSQTFVDCSASQAGCTDCTSNAASASGSCVTGNPTQSFTFESYTWFCPTPSTTSETTTNSNTNSSTTKPANTMKIVPLFIIVAMMISLVL